MDFLSMIPAFLLILLAELGDKTQIAVISLSCRYSAVHVFVGAMLGFLLVDGLSIFAGASLLSVLPLKWLGIIGGVVFVLFGLFTVVSKGENEDEIKERNRLPLVAAFYLVAMSELGDKTQIASILLAAETFWASVFIGVMLAFCVLVSAGVVFGAKVLTRLPKKWLRLGTASLFIILGILSIIGAILEIEII